MTPDEKAFQHKLSSSRFDVTNYLVFADWLQEHDDPRAAGYRLMGEFGMSPRSETDFVGLVVAPTKLLYRWFNLECQYDADGRMTDPASDVPTLIFEKLTGTLNEEVNNATVLPTADYKTAREARDALAVAFSKLIPYQVAHVRHVLTTMVPVSEVDLLPTKGADV